MKGSKDFQQRNISESYRSRGRVPRAQIKQKPKKTETSCNIGYLETHNIQARKVEKKRMERYSERKIMRKGSEDVSTLNPLTSSDSPSTKSKDERFDSAKQSTKRTRALSGEKQTRARSLGPKTPNLDNQKEENRKREKTTS